MPRSTPETRAALRYRRSAERAIEILAISEDEIPNPTQRSKSLADSLESLAQHAVDLGLPEPLRQQFRVASDEGDAAVAGANGDEEWYDLESLAYVDSISPCEVERHGLEDQTASITDERRLVVSLPWGERYLDHHSETRTPEEKEALREAVLHAIRIWLSDPRVRALPRSSSNMGLIPLEAEWIRSDLKRLETCIERYCEIDSEDLGPPDDHDIEPDESDEAMSQRAPLSQEELVEQQAHRQRLREQEWQQVEPEKRWDVRQLIERLWIRLNQGDLELIDCREDQRNDLAVVWEAVETSYWFLEFEESSGGDALINLNKGYPFFFEGVPEAVDRLCDGQAPSGQPATGPTQHQQRESKRLLDEAIEQDEEHDQATAEVILPEHRSRPVTKRRVACLIGKTNPDSGVKYLNKLIEDGEIKCIEVTRQSYIFDLRSDWFDEGICSELRQSS
ncbi:hypothetical protein Mal64_34160 [Pseudobythopirellula maris]|uniref:Uncharacterized protein n=1 Tax=Pseudobythopirellula maris TaxID=2527991 RepID=A0A5C5ZGQ2_9BACT|nr:hypothetical protein [Pseudobythopirellula maris]TWT86589.1 hypothetical protein Mal64_34160 [Pseudobythopirellula maris]